MGGLNSLEWQHVEGAIDDINVSTPSLSVCSQPSTYMLEEGERLKWLALRGQFATHSNAKQFGALFMRQTPMRMTAYGLDLLSRRCLAYAIKRRPSAQLLGIRTQR